MIILPIIGAVTAAQIGLAALLGSVGASFGVLVRHFFRLRGKVTALDERVATLEQR